MAYNYPLPPGMDRMPETDVDKRSDGEIVNALRTYSRPLADQQKNIWAYWHTGWEQMPAWTKRNVIGWCRLHDSSWTVRVLDGVPGSPFNVHEFVGPEFFPSAMNEGRMEGRYAATHCADFARLPLLLLYGGVWIDVGSLLTRSFDDVWSAIEDPDTSYEMAALTFDVRPDRPSVINTVIWSQKDNELIRRWHELFLTVWDESTDCSGLHKHALIRHLDPYGMSSHDSSVGAETMMDYGAQVLCLERLQYLVCDDGFDGPEYFARKMYLLPAMQEMWRYQQRTNYLGSKQHQLLSTPLEPSDECHKTEEWHEAFDFVQDMLRDTHLLKFCHGPKGVMESSLADIWDDPADDGTDSTPGTMAAYLRQGAALFRQRRRLEPVALPRNTRVWHAGLLEPLPCTNGIKQAEA